MTSFGAPASTTSPTIITELPNHAVTWLESVNSAVCVMFCQPPSGSTKTYAAPGALGSAVAGDPTTTVVPLTATDAPNPDSELPSDGVSVAAGWASCQPLKGSTKTYAPPIRLIPSAPATMVLPSIATALPRLTDSAADNVAVGTVVSCHRPAGFVKT